MFPTTDFPLSKDRLAGYAEKLRKKTGDPHIQNLLEKYRNELNYTPEDITLSIAQLDYALLEIPFFDHLRLKLPLGPISMDLTIATLEHREATGMGDVDLSGAEYEFYKNLIFLANYLPFDFLSLYAEAGFTHYLWGNYEDDHALGRAMYRIVLDGGAP